MRIVHVLTRLLRAGSEENTAVSCLAQANDGHEVHVLHGREYLPASVASFAAFSKTSDIPHLIHQVEPKSDVLAVLELVRAFRAIKPDIVHTHQSKAGILGRVAARIAHVPAIVHGVHILPFLNVSPATAAVYLAAERFCGHFTDLFVHVSPGTLKETRARHIGRRAQHIVAESGMDVSRFRDASCPEDAKFLQASPTGSGERPFVVLSLTALEPRKGLSKFLPVFRRIIEKEPNIVLLVAGEGSSKASLQAQISGLGLDKHVRLLGFRTDPERLLAVSDTLAICSEREGLPRAVVQAGIAGVPIVTTAHPGVDAVVRHGETGFIVPLGEHDAMEGCLLDLIRNQALRARLKKNLASIDFSLWDGDAMVRKIDAAYQTILTRSHKAAVLHPGGMLRKSQ